MLSLTTHAAPCPCCAYAHAQSALSFSPLSLFRSARSRRAGVTSATATAPAELHLTGVTVVDPRDGRKSPGMTVVIRAGRITAVVPDGEERPAGGSQRIDARGKYVVPGYNDMHSHVLELADPSGSLALMLAEGVTGFRQMSGSPALLAKRRAGTLPIGAAAPQLLQTPGAILTPFNAATPDTAREEVRRQKGQGADFVKMGFANPDSFFAAVEEGRRIGIPVLGHLQEGTDPVEATAAGFRSIEHLGPGSTVWVRCSRDEEELRPESYRRDIVKLPPFRIPFMERIVMKKFERMLVNPSAFSNEADVDRLRRASESFSSTRAEEMAGHFAGDGSWQCPTLVRLRTQTFADAPDYEQDEMLHYLPRKSVRRWREVTGVWKARTAEVRQTYRDVYPRQLALTKLLHDAGVRMIVGTDGGSYLGPGLTLRQEFRELADAGITPLAILRMATVNAADYLDRRDVVGQVAPGYDADLVVLDADPLARVENLHAIAGVVRAGAYHSRRDLDALKASVAAGEGYLG
ncbi:amidohydrolase family protein [Sphingomonas sp. CL5.1]|uniref:amidohydrolase family protein n=1 Tax=Sphingomonas sp. CL5.1 TaxID=2653203 RepID=UPI001582DF03|nr:amidohydrolase family protein [Sphingomonas sp. CL5.1]QKR99786.1 amidohydrolase family protein [Sphingomonas sp. CL5.1]